MSLSRRNFLKLTGLATGTALLGSAGISYASKNTSETLVLKKDTINIKNLPSAFNGYKIALLSDIHLGKYLPESLLINALNLLNEQKPDVLVLGGDHLHIPSSFLSKIFGFPRNPEFEEGRPRELAKRIITRLATILQSFNAPHGILAIAGNHDNSNAYHFAKKIFEKHNIRYLVNETARFEKNGSTIEFVGVDDYWTGVPRLPRTINSQNMIRILCAHNPDFAGDVFATGKHDFSLALSGHTHAGQICTPSGKPLVCNVYNRSLVHGINKSYDTPILISAGLGMVEIPWRFNCPAEANLISLNVYGNAERIKSGITHTLTT